MTVGFQIVISIYRDNAGADGGGDFKTTLGDKMSSSLQVTT
jgi:hypothetical protein